ncbi:MULTISPECIES: type VI secretion system tip protein VgrG [Lysobacter]|jgi:Rhs element Vgr protein|uniref:type VI secretion system tip protein VgrG n=1 Tax=Lysobacter TaxID=68 RepID=UPI001F29BC72|nr:MULTISPECIES: type VI secretion system tip protein VgrG [Lysobacter]UJB19630.1 type VI secretion system tip protein VgrG [Lysobacter capsici]UJQ26644.1 type VI secretion system tip protein VgrG [Lysobacter gummosus]
MSAQLIESSTDVITLTVRVNGTELPRTVTLQGVEVVNQANRVPYARLRVGDGDAARGDFARSTGELFVPGNQIEVSAGYHGETEVIFGGVILTQRIVSRDGASWLELECRDPVFVMTLVRRNRYFEEMSDSEVASKLLGEYPGSGVSAGKIASSEVKHPQLLQYQSSDWDFLVSRIEAAGQLCFVNAGKMSTIKPALDDQPAMDLNFGFTVLEFDAEIDARTQSGAIRAVAWDPAEQALQEVNAADPGWSGNGNLSASKLSAAAGRSEDVLWHGGSLAHEELQKWADGALLRARLAAARGRVRLTGLTAVKPGTVLQLSRFSERFNGKVYVTAVRHEFSSGKWTTDAEFGLPREPHAARVAMNHLPAAGLAAAVHGLQVGVVTEQDGDPGKEHRVRVKVPLAGMGEQGVWARVATLDAGDQRGTFFRPEKGDEVVLGFFHDDPSQPVILGMLHSSKKAPPLEVTADNHQKAYVSRSGLTLEFDDDKKAITLKTPGNNRIVLSDEDGGITLEDQSGNKLVLGKDGVVIESPNKAVAVTAKTKLEAKGNKIAFEAQTTLEAKAQGAAEVSSSGNLTLKGSMVMIN